MSSWFQFYCWIHRWSLAVDNDKICLIFEPTLQLLKIVCKRHCMLSWLHRNGIHYKNDIFTQYINPLFEYYNWNKKWSNFMLNAKLVKVWIVYYWSLVVIFKQIISSFWHNIWTLSIISHLVTRSYFYVEKNAYACSFNSQTKWQMDDVKLVQLTVYFNLNRNEFWYLNQHYHIFGFSLLDRWLFT